MAKKTSVRPVGDRILLRPLLKEELESKTKSGIILPDTIDKEKSEQGDVIAVGEGRIEDGKKVPMTVKVGDRVVFSKYGYDEIKIDDEEYYIVKEDNILAVVK